MQKQFSDVKEFHAKHHLTWNDEPTLVAGEIREERTRLLQGEANELAEAMRGGSMEDIAKELGDVLYVLFGTAGTLGLADRMAAIFDEVHRSNMSKDYSGTPDSRVVKGPSYRPANIKKVLNM